MKKLYNFFGPVLTILITVSLLLTFLLGINSQAPLDQPCIFYQWGPVIGKYFTILILFIFVISLFYFILGITRYLITVFNPKKKSKGGMISIFIKRGASGIAIAFLLYLLFSIVLGLSHMCPSPLPLP